MIEIKSIASSSTGNCYRITDGKTPLLLECGIPIKRIREALNFGLSDVCGCLLSHSHGDHSKAANEVMKAGINLYTSAGTAKELNLSSHRLKIRRAGCQFNIGDWKILPFETQHDDAEPLGFLMQSGNEKLLFATDTAYIKYRFQGLTHLMIECNYQKEILSENIKSGVIPVSHKNRLLFSHMELSTVLDFLKANDLSKLKELHLLHLSSGNANADEMKEAVMRETGKPTYICKE